MKTNRMPLITVIVPVYNAQDYVESCIVSIISQTYRHLEILLIDDGSTDGSLSICNRYSHTDNRIKVIHKVNEGLVKTRKLGVSCAAGDYITFVDADDWINPDTYQTVLETLGNVEPDMVLYGLTEEYIDISQEKMNTLPAGYYTKSDITESIYPYMLCNGYFFQPGILPNLVCKMIKPELIKNCQLTVNADIEIGEDADCTYQMLLKASSLQIFDYAPYHYRKRNNSMMWNKTELSQCRKLYLDLKAAFLQNTQWKSLLCQLYQYMLFLLLLKKTDMLFEQSGLFTCLRNKRIALYGAGGFGQEVYRIVKEQRWGEVVIWVDKRYQPYQEQNMDVCDVKNLRYRVFDVVFIAILNTKVCEEVKRSLVKIGISPQNVYYITPTVETVATVIKRLEKED